MISIKGSKAEKKNAGGETSYSAYCLEIIQNNFNFTS